jgi:hypothetical protein
MAREQTREEAAKKVDKKIDISPFSKPLAHGIEA